MANQKFKNQKKKTNPKFENRNSLANRIDVIDDSSSNNSSRISKRQSSKTPINNKSQLRNRIGKINSSNPVLSHTSDNLNKKNPNFKGEKSESIHKRIRDNSNSRQTLAKTNSRISNNNYYEQYVKSEPENNNISRDTSLKPLPIFFYLENLHPKTTKQEVINILEKYITKVKYVKMKPTRTDGLASLSIEAVFKTIVPTDIDRQVLQNNSRKNSASATKKYVYKSTASMLELIIDAVDTFNGVEADGKVLSCGYSYGVPKLISPEEWDIIKETF